jgi:hypothetical protein
MQKLKNKLIIFYGLQSHYRYGDLKKKIAHWELNAGQLHHRRTCYQVSYRGQQKGSTS